MRISCLSSNVNNSSGFQYDVNPNIVKEGEWV